MQDLSLQTQDLAAPIPELNSTAATSVSISVLNPTTAVPAVPAPIPIPIAVASIPVLNPSSPAHISAPVSPAALSVYVPKIPYSDKFIIININGIHSITLWFCSCESANPPVQQLMQYWLFPASTQPAWMVATFSLLQEFHLLSLKFKVLAYCYYNFLAHCTNNTGLSSPMIITVVLMLRITDLHVVLLHT